MKSIHEYKDMVPSQAMAMSAEEYRLSAVALDAALGAVQAETRGTLAHTEAGERFHIARHANKVAWLILRQRTEICQALLAQTVVL